MDELRTGVLLPRSTPPNEIPELAKNVELAGFSSLWVPENLFMVGGITGAGLALNASRSLTVGIGVLPAPLRHPVSVAMDIATLTGYYPGRLVPGFGLGVPAKIKQLCAMPDRPVAFIADYVDAVAQLLSGQSVTMDVRGSHYCIDDVQLIHSSFDRPPLAIGAMGKQMLSMAAVHSDQVIFSNLAPPEYVGWASQIVRDAAADAAVTAPRIICFASTSLHEDSEEALRRIKPEIVAALSERATPSRLTEVLGINNELEKMLSYDPAQFAAALPDEWVRSMAIAGDNRELRRQVERYRTYGVDDLIFSPRPESRVSEVLWAIARGLGLKQNK